VVICRKFIRHNLSRTASGGNSFFHIKATIMKLRTVLPAIIAIAAFSSCASAYRTGQTPDDVYYSPAREGAAYAQVEQRRDGRGSYRNDDYYSYDDRWLRMRVTNRYRWSAFDDYDYYDWRYNPWAYNAYSPYYWNSYSYWNNYYYWNSWYNPYSGGIIVVSPKTNPVAYNQVRNFSLSSYTNNNYNNTNAARRSNSAKYNNNARYNNSNSRYNNNNSTLGQSFRNIFGGNSGSGRNSGYSPGSERPTRTYTPPPSSSNSSSRSGGSSGSSGGSSGGGVSRPSRGGN